MKFIIQRAMIPRLVPIGQENRPDPAVGDYWEVTLTCRTEPSDTCLFLMVPV